MGQLYIFYALIIKKLSTLIKNINTNWLSTNLYLALVLLVPMIALQKKLIPRMYTLITKISVQTLSCNQLMTNV